MKLAVALLILASLAVAVAVAVARPWRSRGGDIAQAEAAGAQAPTTLPSETSLGVDAFMRNVDQHRGPVTVVGVVSAASADKQGLTLIDTKEFAECGIGCASLALPVRWAGPAPAAKKTVRVNGEVRESDGKLVFIASALQEVTK